MVIMRKCMLAILNNSRQPILIASVLLNQLYLINYT